MGCVGGIVCGGRVINGEWLSPPGPGRWGFVRVRDGNPPRQIAAEPFLGNVPQYPTQDAFDPLVEIALSHGLHTPVLPELDSLTLIDSDSEDIVCFLLLG